MKEKFDAEKLQALFQLSSSNMNDWTADFRFPSESNREEDESMEWIWMTFARTLSRWPVENKGRHTTLMVIHVGNPSGSLSPQSE